MANPIPAIESNANELEKTEHLMNHFDEQRECDVLHKWRSLEMRLSWGEKAGIWGRSQIPCMFLGRALTGFE